MSTTTLSYLSHPFPSPREPVAFSAWFCPIIRQKYALNRCNREGEGLEFHPARPARPTLCRLTLDPSSTTNG